MKYSKEFLEANARLKTLDEETLNDELNKMSFDELLEHRDYMIQQELGEENQLSEEEAQEQIEELLQMTREPSTDEIQPIKIHTHRTGKRIAALIAAILIMVSVFTVAAVASKRDFSILNGIVRFEDGKVYVKFSRNAEEPTMTLAELETDLREHGFEDIKLPGYFYDSMWKCTSIKNVDENYTKQIGFVLQNDTEKYLIDIYQSSDDIIQKNATFEGAENGQPVCFDGGVIALLVDHGKGVFELKYYYGDCFYDIISFESNRSTNHFINSLRDEKGG